MDDAPEAPVAGREAHASGDWPRAYELLSRARAARSLPPEDLDALSDAAWWLGRFDECLEAGEAAYRGHLRAERPRDAARIALDLAIPLLLRGDEAMGSGWLERARRLLDDLPEGPEHGYVRYLVAVEGGLHGGDPDSVVRAAREVRGIGRRHDDPNLVAGGLLGEGRALLRLGQERGLRLLDEVMVAVTSGELDPEWTGNLYCHLMSACHELADIARARELTEATWAWLSGLPAAVLFTGICRVHRSQVRQATGEWDRAEREAERVLLDLADLHVASVAEAHYQMGDLCRLRGDLDGAVEAFTRARERARDPQPGLALVLLARGRQEAAQAAIGAALHAVSPDHLARARLCAAATEIALAGDDLESARRWCTELEDAAAVYGTSGLEAAASHWRGAVALARGAPEEALPALRSACRRWHEVRAVYDAARSCVLLGEAYEALGDHEAAAAERASAGRTFERLGAVTDLRRLARRTGGRSRPGGLTEREVEVLALVATGRTNREVADALVLSEKTIARHLSNVYRKLDVSTRTEAAAFAFQHGLVAPDRG